MNDTELADLPIVLDEGNEEADGTSRGNRRQRLRTYVQRTRQRVDDAGMATAEYAVGLVGATTFASVLVTLLKGDVVKGLLTGIVRRALSV